MAGRPVIFHNERGSLCAICDGWHEHQHDLPETTNKENTMNTAETTDTRGSADNRKFSVMIFNPNGYSSRASSIAFDSEQEARRWAEKYMEAFPHQSLFLVEGKAEALTPPKVES